MDTHFVQTAPVNQKGLLVGERWVTISAHQGEELAQEYARSMAVSGWVLVDPVAARRRGRGGPIASGLRVISLHELLEEGPESPSVYNALLDLSREDCEWLISSHLGYEAA